MLDEVHAPRQNVLPVLSHHGGVIDVEEELQVGTCDFFDDVERELSAVQIHSGMLDLGVERLEHEKDAGFLGKRRRLPQGENGVGAMLLGRNPVPLVTGGNDQRRRSQPLGSGERFPNCLQKLVMLAWVDKAAARFDHEPGQADARLIERLGHGIHVLVAPEVELDVIETGCLRCPDAVGQCAMFLGEDPFDAG